jgi:transcriptional regulator with XRE-family HTH domain
MLLLKVNGVFIMNSKALGKKIQKYRTELNLTAEKFAEEIDMSVSMIREIERGNKLPSLPTFVKIANRLNVSANDLLSDSINCATHISNAEIADELKGLSASDVSMIKAVVLTISNELRGKK